MAVAVRKKGLGPHPVEDRFAVAKAPVVRRRLDRMADRVSEVELLARAARVAFVDFDEPCLELGALRDRFGQQARLEGQEALPISCKPAKECRIGDDPVLDRLAEAGDPIASIERIEEGELADDERRLVKGPDQILPADRAVDLREERRRDADPGDAAQKGRGDETDGVADDAATQREDRRVSIRLGRQQPAEDRVDRVEVFQRLRGPQRDRRDLPACFPEGLLEDAGVLPQRPIGQDETAARAVAREPRPDLPDDVPPDANLVAALTQIETNRPHAILAAIFSAIWSAVSPSVSIVRSASS